MDGAPPFMFIVTASLKVSVSSAVSPSAHGVSYLSGCSGLPSPVPSSFIPAISEAGRKKVMSFGENLCRKGIQWQQAWPGGISGAKRLPPAGSVAYALGRAVQNRSLTLQAADLPPACSVCLPPFGPDDLLPGNWTTDSDKILGQVFGGLPGSEPRRGRSSANVSLRGRPPVAFVWGLGGCALGSGRAVSVHQG